MRAKTDPTDIVGKQFGKLTVEKFIEKDSQYRQWYLCKCDCGKETRVRRDCLMSGGTKSCGDCSHIEKEDSYYRYFCHKGGSFIFDECDLNLVQAYKWLIDSNGYVRGCHNGGKLVEFSRLAVSAPKEMFVDHVNHDVRDNRRSNLRLVSAGENVHNMKLSRRNTSGYKGVRKNKNCSTYRVGIVIEDKQHYLGSFRTAEEGARAYDEAARKYFGEFACLNFPREGEQGCREAV